MVKVGTCIHIMKTGVTITVPQCKVQVFVDVKIFVIQMRSIVRRFQKNRGRSFDDEELPFIVYKYCPSISFSDLNPPYGTRGKAEMGLYLNSNSVNFYL